MHEIANSDDNSELCRSAAKSYESASQAIALVDLNKRAAHEPIFAGKGFARG